MTNLRITRRTFQEGQNDFLTQKEDLNTIGRWHSYAEEMFFEKTKIKRKFYNFKICSAKKSGGT